MFAFSDEKTQETRIFPIKWQFKYVPVTSWWSNRKLKRRHVLSLNNVIGTIEPYQNKRKKDK